MIVCEPSRLINYAAIDSPPIYNHLIDEWEEIRELEPAPPSTHPGGIYGAAQGGENDLHL